MVKRYTNLRLLYYFYVSQRLVVRSITCQLVSVLVGCAEELHGNGDGGNTAVIAVLKPR